MPSVLGAQGHLEAMASTRHRGPRTLRAVDLLMLISALIFLGSRGFCSGHPASWKSRLRVSLTGAKAVTDRYSALQTLGLQGSTGKLEPKEIKKAFRVAALKYHPDRPGGDAGRFQDVKTAYELLTNPSNLRGSAGPRGRSVYQPYPEWARRRTLDDEIDESEEWGNEEWRWDARPDLEDMEDVWSDVGYNPYKDDDFRSAQPPKPSQSSGYTRGPPSRPTGQTSDLLYIPGIIFAVSLLAFLNGFGTVGNADLESYQPLRPVDTIDQIYKAASYQPLSEDADSAESGPEYTDILGLEYVVAAEAASAGQAPVVLATVPGSGTRIGQLSNAVRAAIDAPAEQGVGKAFGSIVVVVGEQEIPNLISKLEARGSFEGFEKPQVGMFSGRGVARLTRPATEQAPLQDLLIIGTRYYQQEDVKLSEIRQALKEQAPDIVIFDLPLNVWQGLSEELGPVLGSADALQGLQLLTQPRVQPP
mmetsp:Transcript_96580/g.174382  ORF Transcript_96580/g.174382 Transcript_96580/m.174382 type:complete len:475 (-) Transcript_96580:667-2091(-)